MLSCPQVRHRHGQRASTLPGYGASGSKPRRRITFAAASGSTGPASTGSGAIRRSGGHWGQPAPASVRRRYDRVNSWPASRQRSSHLRRHPDTAPTAQRPISRIPASARAGSWRCSDSLMGAQWARSSSAHRRRPRGDNRTTCQAPASPRCETGPTARCPPPASARLPDRGPRGGGDAERPRAAQATTAVSLQSRPLESDSGTETRTPDRQVDHPPERSKPWKGDTFVRHALGVSNAV